MKAAEFGRAVAYPLTELAVLFACVLFFFVFQAALSGNLLAIIACFFVVPAFFRYLMIILESRVFGRATAPPDIDLFLWFGHGWSLFPIVWFVAIGYASYIAAGRFDAFTTFVFVCAVLCFFPASMAVLTLSHSPLESLRPRAVVGVIRRGGAPYWATVAFQVAAALFAWWLSTTSVPPLARNAVIFYLLVAQFALIGTVVRPLHLEREMDIPEAQTPRGEEPDARLAKERSAILDHAYGFISRDNRAGGLGHIRDWLEQDPCPDDAWRWFFEQMMKWERREAALYFAQEYLGRLLQNGEQVAAVKLLLRCRLESDAFRPLPDDRELAIEAAERCSDEELARSL